MVSSASARTTTTTRSGRSQRRCRALPYPPLRPKRFARRSPNRAGISDCDTLVVEGRMEATLDSRVLEIAQNGVFHGTIAVDSAEIHGRFEGELTVRKQLVILGTAKVSGKIRYAKLRIEEGAELSGEISMLDKASAGISVGRRAANAG
jgi:hypothetical protein